MEVTIANCRDSSFSIVELKEGRLEVKKNVKFSKNSTKETLSLRLSKFVLQENQTWRRKKRAFQRHDKKVPYFERTSREEISIP